MEDLSLKRLTKNINYEISEDGVRLKIYGLPYFLSIEDLRSVILNLNRTLERVQMIKKEKEDFMKQISL